MKLKVLPQFTTLAVIAIVTLSACKNPQPDEKLKLTGQEKSVLKKCLDKLYQKNMANKPPYLVYPAYEKFDFGVFAHQSKDLAPYKRSYDKFKERAFRLNDWNQKEFETLKNQIDEEYFGKQNESLMDLSHGESSNVIYFLSGIHENLVFVDGIHFCKCYSKEQLQTSIFSKNNRFSSFDSFAFVLKNGEVQDVIWYDSRIFEGNCEQGEYVDCY